LGILEAGLFSVEYYFSLMGVLPAPWLEPLLFCLTNCPVLSMLLRIWDYLPIAMRLPLLRLGPRPKLAAEWGSSIGRYGVQVSTMDAEASSALPEYTGSQWILSPPFWEKSIDEFATPGSIPPAVVSPTVPPA